MLWVLFRESSPLVDYDGYGSGRIVLEYVYAQVAAYCGTTPRDVGAIADGILSCLTVIGFATRWRDQHQAVAAALVFAG